MEQEAEIKELRLICWLVPVLLVASFWLVYEAYHDKHVISKQAAMIEIMEQRLRSQDSLIKTCAESILRCAFSRVACEPALTSTRNTP